MAKNMFYNYDTYAKNKIICTCEHDLINNCNIAAAEYLYNIKGELLGLKARANSNFNIYFNFSSPDDLEAFEALHKYPIVLEILNLDGELLESIPAVINAFGNECCVNINLNTYKSLKNGKYRLYLYYIEDNTKKILYNESNLLVIK